MEHNMKKETDAQKEVKLSTMIFSTLIVVAGILVIVGVLIYGFGKSYAMIKKIERVIPYPAAIVNDTTIIPIGTLNENVASVRTFYESQDFSQVNMRVDFSSADGEKRLKIKEKQILNRMIEDKAIEILAKQKGITVSDDFVDQSVSRKLEEYGGEKDLKDNLDRLYGWTLRDFKEKVVKPDLYRQELEKVFSAENPSVAEAKEQMEKAKSELDNKKLFVEVAKTYSKGETAGEGGELGWFKKEQLLPEIADTVFSLAKGKRSDVLESRIGFHIIEMEDKKTENDTEVVRLRQIFHPKKTFAEYLTEEIKNIKCRVFLKGYRWNQERGIIEFKDETLKKFEMELNKNSQGDASVLF